MNKLIIGFIKPMENPYVQDLKTTEKPLSKNVAIQSGGRPNEIWIPNLETKKLACHLNPDDFIVLKKEESLVFRDTKSSIKPKFTVIKNQKSRRHDYNNTANNSYMTITMMTTSTVFIYPSITKNCNHANKFVLSRNLLSFLDKENPLLSCLCLEELLWKTQKNSIGKPWRKIIFLRVPNTIVVTQEQKNLLLQKPCYHREADQDMIFLAQWMPCFLFSVYNYGGFLNRLYVLENFIQHINKCVQDLRQRILDPEKDLKNVVVFELPIKNQWKQSLWQWFSWITTSFNLPHNKNNVFLYDVPIASWKKIFSFMNQNSNSDTTTIESWSEINPIWHRILDCYGYKTDIANSHIFPGILDTSCSSVLRVVHPKYTAAAASSFPSISLRYQIKHSIQIMQFEFVNMIFNLLDLSKLKLRGMYAYLNSNSSLLTKLCAIGFKEKMIRAASEWSRETILRKERDVASILSNDMKKIFITSVNNNNKKKKSLSLIKNCT